MTFNPPALRREDADVLSQLNQHPPAQGPQQQQQQTAEPGTTAPQPLTNNQIQEQLNQFLVANGALVRVNDAGRDHGQIRAFGRAGIAQDRTSITKAPPTVVMRNEDYGRIWRLLGDRRPVELEFDIVNQIHPEGRTAYNVDRRNSWYRQGRRGGHARRPSRFVARRDRRHRQCHRMCGDDGGGAES